MTESFAPTCAENTSNQSQTDRIGKQLAQDFKTLVIEGVSTINWVEVRHEFEALDTWINSVVENDTTTPNERNLIRSAPINHITRKTWRQAQQQELELLSDKIRTSV